MNNRTIKTIRWILLVPLTIVVPALAFTLLRNKLGGAYFEAARWFIPALLTIPTVCAIAPTHRKKVATIALICVAGFWLLAFSVLPSMDTGLFFYPDSWAFVILMLCALLLGLVTGFAVVRLVLTRLRRPL